MKQEGLNWAQRANVALGAARGLAYLHDEAEPPVCTSVAYSGHLTLARAMAQTSDYVSHCSLHPSAAAVLRSTKAATMGHCRLLLDDTHVVQ
jgi:23S rRNA A2030 N6-methylase RlmJ